jgi:2-phosphosulfolactate phosphatase
MDPIAADAFPRSYRCQLDWGHDGVRRAAGRGDLVVVVDTLRFSTAVIAAVEQGAAIYPCAPGDDVEALAQRVGADVAAYRQDLVATHRYSLSPGSYDQVPPGTRIVLPSPNGAACCRLGQDAPYLLVGALVNAGAVGAAVSALMEETSLAVTVIACGERWPQPGDDGQFRVAIEDYLGAGAILSALPCDKSPEARVCTAGFLAVEHEIADLLWDSSSGRELRQKGWGADVTHASQLNISSTVPILRQGWLEPFHIPGSD